MNDPIRRAAFLSIARGCGFGGLAIITTMLGISYHPASALRFGGYAWLLVTAILLLMALRAPAKHHTATEVWIMLPQEQRPPKLVAQRVIAIVRRDVMLLFAYWSAWLGAGLLAASLLVSVSA